MSEFVKYLLLPLTLIVVGFQLEAQTTCSDDEPFLLPPTSTFCADSAGIVTIDFRVFNNGDPGTYRVQFPDGTDTVYTNVVNAVRVIKRFPFDCGNPPGEPTPPAAGSLFFEYTGALTIIREDCVDERGDNQRGSYDFRVVPNPITHIKTTDLSCIEEPYVVDFEAEVCSEDLVESYQWFMNDTLLVGETSKTLNGFRFDAPGTHVVRMEVTSFKGCTNYAYERIFEIRPVPEVTVASYTLDSTQLCEPELEITIENEYEFATSWFWTSPDSSVTFSDSTASNPTVTIANNRAGTREIIVVASNAFCAGVTDTIRITTQRGQTIEVAEDILSCTDYDLELCQYLEYEPIPDSITWTSDLPGVDFDDAASICPTVNFAVQGEYTLTASGLDVCGVPFSVPVKVRVRDGTELVIDISEVDTICTTEPSFSILDYVDRPANVSTITGPGVVKGVFTPALVVGDIEVVVTDSCGASSLLNFHVIPQERYEGEDLVICEGGTIDLASVQIADYSGIGVSDNVFNSSGLDVGVYTIKFQSRTFCGGVDSLTVTVQEFPVAAFAIENDSCTLSGGGAGVRYAGLEPLIVDNRSTARVLCYEVLETGQRECGRERARFDFRTPGDYTIQQVVRFPDGECTDTTRQTITVLFPPELQYSYLMDSTSCDSLFITFDLGEQPEDHTFDWSFTSTDKSREINPMIDLLRPLSPEVLGVNASVTNTCYTTLDTFNVVLPLRFRVSFDILNDNNTVCSDDTVRLSNTSVNAVDFGVTYPDGRVTDRLPKDLVLRNTTSEVMRYPMTLSGSNMSCPDEETTDTIYVLPIATEAAFGLDYDDVCSGTEISLKNSSTPGALTFVGWGDGSSPQLLDELETSTHKYKFPRDTTIRIIMSAQLCGLDSIHRDVKIRANPDASFSVVAEQSLCIDQPLRFDNNAGADAYGIEWDFGDGNISRLANSRHVYAKSGSYRVYCKAASENGCVASDSAIINVQQYNGPALEVEMPSFVCTDDLFPLELRSPFDGWRIDYGNGRVVNTPIDKPYPKSGDYIMRLAATSPNGCTRDTAALVRVIPGFSADIITADKDTIINLGDEIELAVEPTTDRNISAITWTGEDIYFPSSQYSYAQPTVDSYYRVELEDEFGCKAVDSMRVRVLNSYADRVYAPNVFTPNGDGFNDRFNLDVKDLAVESVVNFKVMARTGALVYECTDCATGLVFNGWDGRVGGLPVESSVYIWTAEIDFVDGTRQVITGDVALMR